MCNGTKLDDLNSGDTVSVTGLTCLTDGSERVVLVDDKGSKFIKCAHGQHHLDGQLAFDGSGTLVGVAKVVH